MAAWLDELGVDSTGNTLTINKVIHVFTLGKYIAVGQRTGTIPTNTNTIWTSIDGGVTWKIQASAKGYHWTSVTWSEALQRLVAVTDTVIDNVGGLITDQVQYSADGVTWTSATSAERNAWQDVVWADSLNLFVAVANGIGAGGNTHRVMTSPDGILWTARTASPFNFAWGALAWSPILGLLVATATDAGTTSVMTSSDGIVWTQRSTTTSVQARLRGLAWSPSLQLFVSSCGLGHVLRSANGQAWLDWAGIPAGWNSTLGHQVAWCPLDVVGFQDGTPKDIALLGMAANNVFCIAAGAGIAAIITSADGMTWLTEPLPSLQLWGAVGAQQPATVIAPPGAIIGSAGTPPGPSPGADSGPTAGCLAAISPGVDSGPVAGCLAIISPGKDSAGV